MYLLDTNVVSELRRPRPDRRVLDWIEGVSHDQLHLCAVTVGEVQAGIELTREQDPAKAAELEEWVERILGAYAVLAVDAAAFREWARLMHRRSETLMQDALIAAVASVNRLTVVTRNVRDFEQLGVPTFDPFRHR